MEWRPTAVSTWKLIWFIHSFIFTLHPYCILYICNSSQKKPKNRNDMVLDTQATQVILLKTCNLALVFFSHCLPGGLREKSLELQNLRPLIELTPQGKTRKWSFKKNPSVNGHKQPAHSSGRISHGRQWLLAEISGEASGSFPKDHIKKERKCLK